MKKKIVGVVLLAFGLVAVAAAAAHADISWERKPPHSAAR